ncbi:MAG: ATP-binding protein [Candidatus Ornithospirochaeta sp.]|nr:ATP-binding protein [Sphaerochaetaceae bacterium]MDY5523189.1 ATP-binding protein [Candidatus Ornithospirochaeta sp.]
MKLIGREKEIRTLEEAMESKDSVFLAVYGRRRVGKTFLLRQTLSDRIVFSYSGKANITRQSQLKSFRLSLMEQGMPDCPVIKDWFTAFSCLKRLICLSSESKKVILLDEVAWMDNHKSDFIPALEGFWNEWCSNRNDIFLIICASATSWIIDNVFHNRGGLHNRVTMRMRLSPFTLKECEEFSIANNLSYSRKDILNLYLAIGGVAWYWTLLKKGYSVKQNISQLFFENDSPLRGEFFELYSSLFIRPEKYIDIILALGKKSSGLERQELSAECKVSNNSKLGKMLQQLEECGFIRSYIPYGKKENSVVYQLIDSFSLFHLKFLSKFKGEINSDMVLSSSSYNTYCGLAFEKAVMNHLNELKRAMGISGINTQAYTWRSNPKKLKEGEKGAQIDIVLDRADGIINIIEAKWTSNGEPYMISSSDEEDLLNKRRVFIEQTQTRKSVFLTMVTISGIKKNSHFDSIQNFFTLDDLF